jgi:hypothetical protein
MQFNTRSPVCVNCKSTIDDKAVFGFQGLQICGTCAVMVKRTLEKTQQQMDFMMRMYHEVLRVALLKGEFRFPELPDVKPGEKLQGVPTDQLIQEVLHMMFPGDQHEQLRIKMARGQEGHSRQMPEMRNDPQSDK